MNQDEASGSQSAPPALPSYPADLQLIIDEWDQTPEAIRAGFVGTVRALKAARV
jgi:hypothetical protein